MCIKLCMRLCTGVYACKERKRKGKRRDGEGDTDRERERESVRESDIASVHVCAYFYRTNERDKSFLCVCSHAIIHINM